MQNFDTIYQRLLSKSSPRFHRSADQLNQEHRLFLEWVAEELQELYREIGQSRDYIQKTILQKRSIEMEQRPRPVHGLAQAQPKKQGIVLSPADEPFTMSRMSAEPPYEIYFTPLRRTPLVHASIKYVVKGKTLKDISSFSTPETLVHTQNNKSFHEGVLWWGIEVEDNIDLEDELHFYISWKNLTEQTTDKLYDVLPLIQWILDEQKLKQAIGFGNWFNEKNQAQNQFLDTEYLFLHGLETDILDHYKNRFVTLYAPEKWLSDKNKIPNELLDKFDKNSLSEICTKRIIWLKMVFPAGFSAKEVVQTQIQLNCFPIINRKLNKSKDRPPSNSDFFEIIPLSSAEKNHLSLRETRDFFLGMQKLSSENRGTYKPVNFEDFQHVSSGYYALQADRVEVAGVQTFQSRVAELTHYLKYESERLKKIDDERVGEALSTIEEGAEKLAEALNHMPIKDDLPRYYLHIKLMDNQQMISVRFWVTQGVFGEGMLRKEAILKNNKNQSIHVI